MPSSGGHTASCFTAVPDIGSRRSTRQHEFSLACRSIEREPAYVDLEDCPTIDAQHPPDLRQYVPEAPGGAPESEQAAAAKAAAAAAIAGQTVGRHS